jgi:hypothetical protein
MRMDLSAVPYYGNTMFFIEPYKSQWGHLPLVLLPFLGLMGIVMTTALLNPIIGDDAALIMTSSLGACYAAFVFSLPRLWKRWRGRGRREPRIEGDRLEVIDPVGGLSLGSCRFPDGVIPGEFSYTVSSRFAGGTYRAPAFVLGLEGHRHISVGVVGSPLTWSGELENVARPDYSMTAAEWRTSVETVGMENRLTAARSR